MRSQRAGSRRAARAFALQALYRLELLEDAPDESALDAVWAAVLDDEGLPDTEAPDEEQTAFAQRLFQGVCAQRDEIDTLIESCSINWRVKRMPLVDRNILRIAALELLSCADIPASVTCNEAVELAKRYGGSESRAFINGLVDKMGRQTGRIGR